MDCYIMIILRILYPYQQMLMIDETIDSITRSTPASRGRKFKNERPIEQKTECRCATPAVLQKKKIDVSGCDALAATRHTATASTERGVPVEKI